MRGVSSGGRRAPPLPEPDTRTASATSVLMPVSCRRQLVDLSDDMATRVDVQFYSDARDALFKAMVE